MGLCFCRYLALGNDREEFFKLTTPLFVTHDDVFSLMVPGYQVRNARTTFAEGGVITARCPFVSTAVSHDTTRLLAGAVIVEGLLCTVMHRLVRRMSRRPVQSPGVNCFS